MTETAAESSRKTDQHAEMLEGSKHGPVSLRSQYFTLFILGVVVMFTVLDRQIMALMIEPIKSDYNISDTQVALLLGAAFSLPYAIAGLPIARLADVRNRKKIIAASIAVWSTMTVACGITQSYVQLLFARMGIGAGEAGYGPASWSILTDSFPRERVAFATGTMAIGSQVGTGLALIIGGSALALVAHMPTVDLPFIGALRPWQWAFVIVGFPGLLWALVVLVALKEPKRRGTFSHGETARKATPIKEVAAYMLDDWRTYLAVIGGHSLKYLFMLGTTQWMPTLFYREFGWSLTKIGLIQGTLIIVVGSISLIVGGKLSEYMARKGVRGANLRIVFYSMLISVPLSMTFPLMPNPWVMLGMYGIIIFVSNAAAGPAGAAAQVITPNPMRAQVSAVKLFSSNVIAFALGPLIVALFTDYLFEDPNQLKYSMSLAAIVLGPPAIFIVWQGLETYARSYERTAAEFAD